VLHSETLSKKGENREKWERGVGEEGRGEESKRKEKRGERRGEERAGEGRGGERRGEEKRYRPEVLKFCHILLIKSSPEFKCMCMKIQNNTNTKIKLHFI
jgi:hypothetical protein